MFSRFVVLLGLSCLLSLVVKTQCDDVIDPDAIKNDVKDPWDKSWHRNPRPPSSSSNYDDDNPDVDVTEVTESEVHTAKKHLSNNKLKKQHRNHRGGAANVKIDQETKEQFDEAMDEVVSSNQFTNIVAQHESL